MRFLKFSVAIYLLFAAIPIILISCEKNHNANDGGRIVKFALQKNIDSFPLEVKYIPLETSENCLIGSVDQLAMTDEAIFVLESDQERGGMYVFDKKGAFVARIGNRGRGPGEYILPMSFTINGELIGILDGGMNKLLYYDIHTFEFIRQRPIFNSTYFEWLDDATMVWGNDETNPEIPYSEFSYVVTDTSLKVSAGYPDKVIRSGYSIVSGKPIYRFKDEVRMYDPFTPTVYTGTAKDCHPVYTIDFDPFELPSPKFMKKISRNNQCYFDELENSGYISSYEFFETEEALCVRYMVKHEKYIGLYSKTNGQGFACKKDDFEKKISHKYSYISGVAGDYFVAPLFIPLLRENTGDMEALPAGLKRIVDVSSDGDNPILFLFRLGS